jgi:type I restriction enzyme S subunit
MADFEATTEDFEGVDLLPKGWEWTKVEVIADLLRGVTYEKSVATGIEKEGYIPILRASNIQAENLILDQDLVYVPRDYVKEHQLLRAGDVVICMSSGSKYLVGKTAQLIHEWYGSFGAFCATARFVQQINPKYAGYYFGSKYYRDFIRLKSSGININNLRPSDIEALRFPLAPIEEQQRIVEAIESLFTQLDAGVAALKRLRANLKRYKAAVLKAACEGKLVPQDPNDEPASDLLERILAERRAKWEAEQRTKGKDPRKLKYEAPAAPDTSDLPELPEGWVWASMKQVGDIQLGRQRAPQHHTGDYMHPYLRVANVFEDYIDATDVFEMNFTPQEYDTYLLHYNDILLNEGQSLELVGRSAIYKNEVPGACFTNTLVRFRTSEGVLTEYAQLVFRAYLHSGRFQKIAKWTTNIAHLGAQRFAELEFPLPSLSEQENVVTEVERLMSVVRYLELTIDYALKRAERLRQAILKQAFEGKLVLQDPNDEPASVLLERIGRGRK